MDILKKKKENRRTRIKRNISGKKTIVEEFLNCEELLEGKLLWINGIQHEYLINDVRNFNYLKKQLELFCENGLWETIKVPVCDH